MNTEVATHTIAVLLIVSGILNALSGNSYWWAVEALGYGIASGLCWYMATVSQIRHIGDPVGEAAAVFQGVMNGAAAVATGAAAIVAALPALIRH